MSEDPGRKEKKIEETIDKPMYDQLHQRLQTPYAKKMKKLRQATVEPVLGTSSTLWDAQNIDRGLQSANKFMLGAAIAYNLKKWLNYGEQKRKKAAVMAIKKSREGLYFLFYVLWCSLTWYSAKNKINYR